MPQHSTPPPSLPTTREGHFDERVSDLEQRMVDLELIRIHEINDERDNRVAAVETAVEDLVSWLPEVDGLIDDLRLEVKNLRSSGGRAAVELPTSVTLRQPELVAARSSAGTPTNWPSGHRVESTTRERGYGLVTTIAPTPANGMRRFPDPPPHSAPYPRPPPTLSTKYHRQSSEGYPMKVD